MAWVVFSYLFNSAITLWHQDYIMADLTEVFINIVFSDVDEDFDLNLYQLKGYKVMQLMNEFTITT